MNLDEVKDYIRTHEIHAAVEYFLSRDSIPAIPDKNQYADYKQVVKNDHPYAKKYLLVEVVIGDIVLIQLKNFVHFVMKVILTL